MPLPRGYISHSQIRLYNECPRKYFFAYVEEIRPPVNDKVFLGEMFHQAIEMHFRSRIDGAPLPDGEVTSAFVAAFDEAAATREINWQAPQRETRERGLAFLRYFLEHIAPGIRPLMTEKELSAELPGSGVALKGVIDLVEEDFCITDFKTATSRWSDSKASQSPQMLIYKYLFDRSFGPVCSSLKYEVLYARHAGNVRHQTLRLAPAAEAQENLLAMIDRVVRSILSGEFQPLETPYCRYCEFRARCLVKAPG
ncbi:MAG: PD-(D/E)XK nuclease family protein [Candidatus Aminicenantes bacterium]|nr:PD-(D/E)XK nuclease family protein [Candidatus Aminicenantes bacterium]